MSVTITVCHRCCFHWLWKGFAQFNTQYRHKLFIYINYRVLELLPRAFLVKNLRTFQKGAGVLTVTPEAAKYRFDGKKSIILLTTKMRGVCFVLFVCPEAELYVRKNRNNI